MRNWHKFPPFFSSSSNYRCTLPMRNWHNYQLKTSFWSHGCTLPMRNWHLLSFCFGNCHFFCCTLPMRNFFTSRRLSGCLFFYFLFVSGFQLWQWDNIYGQKDIADASPEYSGPSCVKSCERIIQDTKIKRLSLTIYANYDITWLQRRRRHADITEEYPPICGSAEPL